MDNHLEYARLVLTRLYDAGLRINTQKSKFFTIEMEYLVYIFTRTGIKPQPNKAYANLALNLLNNVKDLCRFMDMVQYYRDLWAR